jgi:3-hydroxypropanoate dehydrogenase
MGAMHLMMEERPPLDDATLAQLFTEARTFSTWLDRPVDDVTLRRIYDLARLGPTAANSQPMRIVFVRTPEGKARLMPHLDAGNVPKVEGAPVTAIVAFDTSFYAHLGRLYPPWKDAAESIGRRPSEARERMALMNTSLQAGYFILAARSLGLDCGPMGGFNASTLDQTFFPQGRWRSVLLVNLGYGDRAALKPRNPRFEFDEVCVLQ